MLINSLKTNFRLLLSSATFISTLLICDTVSAQIANRNSRNKDIVESDTVFQARRAGNEIKAVLNSSADFSILINNKQNILINAEGNTGLGTTKPEYRLDVCGTIRASEEIIVETNEWCDFVFSDDYELQNFNKRIEYIKTAKHLPYIESESQVLSNGISVSQTITGLLRNIEEMYLYLEQLEKRISLLEDENASLKTQIAK